MKALSMTQPYATAVVRSYFANGRPVKGVETRSWSTSLRGEIAIHAAKGFPGWARDFAKTEYLLGRLPEKLPLMAIVGTVEIVRMDPTQNIEQTISALERLYGDYSWGRFGWSFDNARELPEPIPCKGALGLWSVPLDVEARIRQQIERAA